MRPTQKLAVRASEIREKLSTFAEIEGELSTMSSEADLELSCGASIRTWNAK